MKVGDGVIQQQRRAQLASLSGVKRKSKPRIELDSAEHRHTKGMTFSCRRAEVRVTYESQTCDTLLLRKLTTPEGLGRGPGYIRGEVLAGPFGPKSPSMKLSTHHERGPSIFL